MVIRRRFLKRKGAKFKSYEVALGASGEGLLNNTKLTEMKGHQNVNSYIKHRWKDILSGMRRTSLAAN